jgi:hypothetical protein
MGEPYRVLVTGSRDTADATVIHDALDALLAEHGTLILQRVGPGKLAPDEASRKAEAERDEALAELVRLKEAAGGDPASHPDACLQCGVSP